MCQLAVCVFITLWDITFIPTWETEMTSILSPDEKLSSVLYEVTINIGDTVDISPALI
jgi:hypothetical protein